MALVSTTLTGTGSVTLTNKKPSEKFVRITLTGTYTGVTADLSASLTSTPDYAPIGCLDETAYADVTSALISTSAANKTYQLNGAGLQAIKVNVSAFGTGSVKVSIYTDDHGALTQVAGA
jgi:hypothetical protein